MNQHITRKIVSSGASLTLAMGTVLAAAGPAAAQDQPVTTPAGFQAEVGASSVAVTWEPSTSDAEVLVYYVKLDGRWMRTVEPTMTFHLVQNRTYRMEVQAQDAEFRLSDWSDRFEFTTPDEFPVTTPGNVRVTDSPGSATVEWDPSTSDAEVLDYVAILRGGPAGTVGRRTSGTSATFDVPPGGNLDVTVQARDRAYRYSDTSAPVEFTVAPSPDWEPPDEPTNLRASFDSGGRVEQVAWDAADGTGPVTYHLHVEGSGEIERTTQLEVELFGFVECTGDTPPTTAFFVIATADGIESPASEPITMCS